MEGWIKVHRKILDNPVVCKDADHLAIWMYLLLNATHANYDSMFKGKRITLNPGQLITGRKSISVVLKIDENKVQRVLKSFENEHQIEQQTSNQNRLITILNWINYQDTEQPIEQQVNNERTTDEQQVNTNKNVKNDKNVNNIYSVLDSYSTNNDLKQALRDFLEMRKKIKAPMTDKAFNMLLIELDKLAATDEMKIKLLEESILHNWKSVYPLKQPQQNKQQSQTKPNKFHNFEGKMKNYSETELEEKIRKNFKK